MSGAETGPRRLYLMRVASAPPPINIPYVCYLIQTSDGHNILVDTGIPTAELTPPPGMPEPVRGKSAVEQLAMLGLQPEDIDILVATHFDMDHAGNLAAFPRAQLVAQRRHYEVAREGHPRFARSRPQWDQPAERYRLVDGDVELVPGVELIETSGHVPGHQAVLVRLPNTGAVLLTIDAVAVQRDFTPDRSGGRMGVDMDAEGTIASTRKLIDVAQREHASLVIFGHDAAQWQTLKLLPEFYD